MNEHNQQRALLILDLDECLIFGAEKELHRPADFHVGPYHVYCRPGLADFLFSVENYYDLAVWSSATSDYVEGITSQIQVEGREWKFVWARDRCTTNRDYETLETIYIKDLKKVKRLGYSLDRILFVDDTPNKMSRNYGNAIYIQPFEGSDDDCELPKLAKYLSKIRNEPNYRTIEKRGWRNQVNTSDER